MDKHYLWQKLGPIIQAGLHDDTVFEIILNPDSSLWFKSKISGNKRVGEMASEQSDAFVHALAQFDNKYLNDQTPYLDATLPFNGERINVTIAPVSSQTSFNIRKKSKRIFTLNDYVASEIITDEQADILKNAIIARKNILISGSPAAGKTTFANALLDTLDQCVDEGHRVILLEQVPELQCNVKNFKSMITTPHVSMNTLLWLCMRNSPDRIVVGEVRDGAALDLLKAWNTGCPGGLATIHSNSAESAIQRILDLACEVVSVPPYALAAEALNIIVHLQEEAHHSAGRRVTSMIEIIGFNASKQQFSFKTL